MTEICMRRKSEEEMSELAPLLMFVFDRSDVIKRGNTMFEARLRFNRKEISYSNSA